MAMASTTTHPLRVRRAARSWRPRAGALAALAVAMAVSMAVAAPGPARGHAVTLSVLTLSGDVRHDVEWTGLHDGVWPQEVRKQAAIADRVWPFAARTRVDLEGLVAWEWPAGQPASLELAGTAFDRPTGRAQLDRAILTWLVPAGTLRAGLWWPEWGKGLAHQPSSPFGAAMSDPPLAAELVLASTRIPVSMALGHAWGAGVTPQEQVPWVKLRASGEGLDGALAAGHHSGRGAWASAEFSADLPGTALQLYGEAIGARAYRPARLTTPSAANGWTLFDPAGYGPAVAVGWLFGVGSFPADGWRWVAELRGEPGGLDDQEAARFWLAAAGHAPLPAELDPDVRRRLAMAYSGQALQLAGGLAEAGRPLRRHYLDWSVQREFADEGWSLRLDGSFGLDDGSSAWMPEVAWTARDGVQPAVRGVLLLGPVSSEWGAGPNRWSVQLSIRTSFP